MCILDKYQHQPFLEEGVSKVKEVLVVQCVLFLILKIDTLSYWLLTWLTWHNLFYDKKTKVNYVFIKILAAIHMLTKKKIFRLDTSWNMESKKNFNELS